MPDDQDSAASGVVHRPLLNAVISLGFSSRQGREWGADLSRELAGQAMRLSSEYWGKS